MTTSEEVGAVAALAETGIAKAERAMMATAVKREMVFIPSIVPSVPEPAISHSSKLLADVHGYNDAMPDSHSADAPIRVLIADDESLMRQAFRTIIDTADGFECVGEVRNGAQALHHVEMLNPDVVLMDLQMPEMDGVEATGRIVEKYPDVKILAVTAFSSEEYLIPALRAGAAGYLVKDTTPESMLSAIRSVYAGESVLSPAVSRKLVDRVMSQPAHGGVSTPRPELGERELEVVQYLANGLNNAEIAARLGYSEASVKLYLSRAMAKLNVRDRVQTLIVAMQWGLVTPNLDRN